ncbi:hypothetical protein [Streptomyces candidus]|uniref:Uncharacterized protein n=1 Tax=Streptomyces candidus TaxID=67283 RepID=A0A7X0HLW6_9ACTN|nr:hypothetical protein [Streptomyces candidus]MBB6439961.1 hypothetical protein [Streptomyces candidus]GHH56107.1 hypothetical protein GCM10018773_61460 [Streptomyces candidus]
MTTTSDLEALRKKADRSAKTAEDDRAALLDAAVKAAITSSKYGHLSAVAREAGITSQYLRDLVEAAHPGWLAKAAEEREAAKAEHKPKSRVAKEGRAAKEGGGRAARPGKSAAA